MTTSNPELHLYSLRYGEHAAIERCAVCARRFLTGETVEIEIVAGTIKTAAHSTCRANTPSGAPPLAHVVMGTFDAYIWDELTFSVRLANVLLPRPV